MIEVLTAAGVRAPVVVLGHMAIYHSLVGELGLDERTSENLFAAVQSKAESDIRQLVPAGPVADALVQLPTLMGAAEVIDQAREVLAVVGGAALAALDQLAALAALVEVRAPEVAVRFDLAELAGYGYHNGPVFSAYHADLGQALARGGRYDGIGEEFGRSRPATGFDVSLKALVTDAQPISGIWAPWVAAEQQQSLGAAVHQLRKQGEAVVAAITATDAPADFCSRQLVLTAGDWVVQDLSSG
jgi:ATP phosphoribosyltransferase regulatory subunit